MANYFTLTKKGADKPSAFCDIDDEICKELFNVEPDKHEYIYHWYDIIGLKLACGKEWDLIEQDLESEQLKKITRYLRDHYISDAWSQYGNFR